MKNKILPFILLFIVLGSFVFADFEHNFTNSDDLTKASGWVVTSGYLYYNTADTRFTHWNIETEVGKTPVFYTKMKGAVNDQGFLYLQPTDWNTVTSANRVGAYFMYCSLNDNTFTLWEYQNKDDTQYIDNLTYYKGGTCNDNTIYSIKIELHETKGGMIYYKTDDTSDDVEDTGWTLLYDSSPDGKNNGRTHNLSESYEVGWGSYNTRYVYYSKVNYTSYDYENTTITAKNSITNNDINSFTANVNGTLYTTTNGTIVLPWLTNESKEVNITILADNYETKNYEDYNTSVNLISYLTPFQLVLTFSTNTTGYIVWEVSENETDGYFFTNQSVYNVSQENVPLGYVSVVYNDGQQLFEYYNDRNTTINQNLEITNPDLVQPFQIWDGTASTKGRIILQKLVNTSFQTVYAGYTNTEGVLYIPLEDGTSYKVTAEADGYTDGVHIVYIAPTENTENTDVILVELGSTSIETNKVTITNACGIETNDPLNCLFTVTSSDNSYNMIIEETNSLGTTNYSYSESKTTSQYFNINESTGNTTFKVYLDGDLEQILQTRYKNKTSTSTTISAGREDNDWAKGSEWAILIFGLVIAALIGRLFENLYKGWGMKIGILTLGITTGSFVPIMWAVVAIPVIWTIYDYKRAET